MSSGDTQLLADAFNALNNTLKAFYAVFFRMDIIGMVLLMFGLVSQTVFFCVMFHHLEYRLHNRMDGLPADVARAINIQVTQQVDVDEPSKQDAILKIIADKRAAKLKEQGDARLRTD